MDCSPPGSSIHWFSQTRRLECVATSFSAVSSQPGDQILVSYVAHVSCIAGQFFTTEPPGKPTHTHIHTYLPTYMHTYLPVCVCILVTQSCPAICDPMDCSLPGSSVHEILQATILEWVTIPFSGGSSCPRD